VKVTFEFEDCPECPFYIAYRGHRASWYECGHPDHPDKAYGNIIHGIREEYKKLPEFCPLTQEKL